jgi:hypothetical protein
MTDNEKKDVLRALAVCAELIGSTLSDGAVRAMAEDLWHYPYDQIIGALGRCRRELRGRLTPGEILDRLTDGRPGPQEAWAIVAPTFDNEGPTVVWTEEMAESFGVARMAGDAVAARMAFIESYRAKCQQSRDKAITVRWTMSLGTDRYGRDGPLLEAVSKGRLPAAAVEPHLIGESAPQDLKRIANVQKVDNLLAGLVAKIDEKAPRSDSKAIANRTPSTSPQNRT